MTTYNVSVRAIYYDDLTVVADSKEEAYKLAVQTFEPTSNNCMGVDVHGLSPWEPVDGREDYEYETARQREIDNEA